MSAEDGTWAQTACILCECNCGIEVQLDGRTLDAHPRRQGASGVAGLHLQQGDAPRPLPERPTPPDLADAAPARRQLRGGRLGHRDRRDRRGLQAHRRRARRRVDLLLRRRRPGKPPRRQLQRRLPARASGRATARARWRRRRPARAGSSTRSTAATRAASSSTPRSSVFIGKNPWMSQSFPRARVVLREIAKDPERSMIVIDPVVTDTAKLADFHLRVRPGHRRLVPGGDGRRAGAGGPRRPRVPRRHTSAAPTRVLERFGRVDVAGYAGHCGVDEALIRAAVRRIAERGERVGVRGPRRSSRARTARSAPTSTGCCGS